MSQHSKKNTIIEDQPSPAEATADSASPDTAIAALEERVRAAEDAALRSTAEFQNLKRRQREEMERLQDTATKELVLSLLPVVDDLERALDAAGSTANSEALKNGVELTLTKLLAALGTVGVQKLPAVGEQFDPFLHEAAMQLEPSESYPSGTIAQELRSGYTQHGHVIRPSLVGVAHD
ncbi:MAG TPA: nucleotide exchange factor GrpE [Armatimonadota bacterium]|jgi:molecular chaperone GrpE